jgi:hypothetical protein
MVYSHSNVSLEKMLVQFISEEDPMLSMLKRFFEKLMTVEVDGRTNASNKIKGCAVCTPSSGHGYGHNRS